MDSAEIRELLFPSDEAGPVTSFASFQQSYILYNMSEKQRNDLSLSELLINKRFVPLLQTEGLAEYFVKKVSFASLCEFRSKMGFKYVKIDY